MVLPLSPTIIFLAPCHHQHTTIYNQTYPTTTVAFPYRKSYFFDNKLEFSNIKIAIGQGFRQSNFKVKQSSDRSESLVFQVQTFRFISDIGVIDELSASGLGRILRVCTWQPSHLATVLLWCLLKVRLCSPLQLGLTFLVGASLDYPQLLRLALPNPFMHESFR